MNEQEQRVKKERFLDEFIFIGLHNLNNGFDSKSIKYFSASDFKIVLNRVEKLKLGIYGIEPWLNGEMFDVYGFDDFAKEPTDSTWYKKAFELFINRNPNLLYSGSFFVPQFEKQL